MDDFIEYIRGLPWKDWSGPLITGFLALIGVVYVQYDKKQMASEQRREEDSKADKDRLKTFETAQTQDLTERIKALMDGYENHIKNLSAELIAAKAEARELRDENQRLRDKLDAC